MSWGLGRSAEESEICEEDDRHPESGEKAGEEGLPFAPTRRVAVDEDGGPERRQQREDEEAQFEPPIAARRGGVGEQE